CFSALVSAMGWWPFQKNSFQPPPWGPGGNFAGSSTRIANSTSVYDNQGRYQGSVTTMPPTSFERAFNFKGSDNCQSERTRKMPSNSVGALRRNVEQKPQRSQPCQRKATGRSFPSLTRRRLRRFKAIAR